MRIVAACCFLLIAGVGAAMAAEPAGPAAGLKLTLESNGVSDVRPARLVALRIAPGAPTSPFLTPGPFKATWEGAITQRIKGDYSFSALGRGALKITINDAVVLDVSGDDFSGKPGANVTLKKGKNVFRAEYASPKDGEAAVRLLWIPKGVMPESVPPAVFSYDAESDEKLLAQNRLRRGRELFAEHRCIKCHAADLKPDAGAMLELSQDAPNLDGIGGRVKAEFLARWITDPKSIRPTTAMPRLFKSSGDGKIPDEAAHIAAYLASDGAAPPMTEVSPGAADDGARLFANLGCVGCHVAPGIKDPTTNTPRPRNPLAHVPDKYHFPALVAFLTNPQEHYTWSKMPNFRLSDEEANAIGSFLFRGAEARQASVNGDAAKGKELFQSSGCVNCHTTTKTQSTLKSKSLGELSSFEHGCLAKDDARRGKAPDFGFTDDDRAALVALAKTKFESVQKDTPAEFAERQIAMLNCIACHPRDKLDDTWSSLVKDEVETILKDIPPEDPKKEEQFSGDQARPPLTWLGEKLRPQWAAKFIGGKVEYKPRPWLRARMPGFPARADALASGLAAEHGVATVAPPNEKPDPAQAGMGRKLVARQGGFSCVQCHGVGEMKAFSPFEAPAINFAHVSDRLTREYYDRWVYNPQRVLPGTRMPSFADSEGKTALKDILGGDAKKQFDAIWNYLLAGPAITPPE